MALSLGVASCGKCGEDGTVVPVNIGDLNEDPNQEDWVVDWKCTSCGDITTL